MSSIRKTHKNQLFVIPLATMLAMDVAEVEATASAMKEFGIWQLPFEQIDLWLCADAAVHFRKRPEYAKYQNTLIQMGCVEERNDKLYCTMGETAVLEVKNLSTQHMQYTKTLRILPGNPWFKPMAERYDQMSPPAESEWTFILDLIIVLLNTKNALKEVKRNKLAGLGIGKKAGGHEYITTIRPPAERAMEDAEGEAKPSGLHKKPHLRRGHPRSQAFGPRGSGLHRPIWIQPIFVNADPDWVNKRERYNVSL